MNTCSSLLGHPRHKGFDGGNEFYVVRAIVGLRVLSFQSNWIGPWKCFTRPTKHTSAKRIARLVQSSGAKLVSTAGNADSDWHRAQLNCLCLTNPHLNSRYLMIVRRIDIP